MAIDKEFNKFENRLNSLYPLLTEANQKSKKQIYMQIIDACRPIDLIPSGDKFLITNNYISNDIFSATQYQQFLDSWYGIYAGVFAVENISPAKEFNCFINRMDPIRQSWLYQLIRCNLFDRGYISFNMDVTNISTNDTAYNLFIKQFHTQLPIFEIEHNIIKHLVPYRNFDPEISLGQVIMNSKFSIVLETFFDRNGITTFSEKIFRCLKLPRPWILFSSKSAVSRLRTMGFDVLDDLVDHSYDDIDFAIERQSKLLSTAQDLCDKLQLTTQIQARLQQAANHNQQLIETFSGTWEQDVHTTFCQAIIKSNI